MKGYFPFTDYDFYAYLVSGSLLLAVVDFVFNDAAVVTRDNWTFVQVVLVIASAYVLGHLIAWFSQMIIEMWIMRRLLTAPIKIQLGFKAPNLAERLLGVAVGRYYAPFDPPVRQKILATAANVLGCTPNDLDDAEVVFQVAHGQAMSFEAVRSRADEFRNQYGLFRNVTLVGLLATGMLGWSAWGGTGSPDAAYLAALAAVASFAAFLRFAKFYVSFGAEVLRILLKEQKI